MRTDANVELVDRREECRVLDELLARLGLGRSAALLMRGEAGIGKTVLLDFLRERADGCDIISVAGVQSEMELSYASLHQLCAPLMAGMDRLPDPQREALATAFGLRAGAAPDPYLVGLAALTLLADAGADRPLLCVIDDAQWLDRASALTMGFVARRLFAESVLLVFAVRDPAPTEMLAGIPELLVGGLSHADSRTLLDSVLPGPLDQRVRERIVSEARGNPLALLELPRGLTGADIVRNPSSAADDAVPQQVESGFIHRIESMPDDSRSLLLLAAADPLGDLHLLRRAAVLLGIDIDVAGSRPEVLDLITLGSPVRFRHPLVRSAAYRAATPEDRHAVHRALAESTDGSVDPDRRAWHRAQAASAPDEEVAADLERSAERARARGGVAAMAAFLEHATELTLDPARRSARALDAAQAKVQAGEFDTAVALLAVAMEQPGDEVSQSRIDVSNAQIAFAQGRSNEALPLLLDAADRLQDIDLALARDTYLEAVSGVIFAGHLAGRVSSRDVAEAARRAPALDPPRPSDMLLDALAVRLTDGFAASAPRIERVLTLLCAEDATARSSLRWLLLAGVIAADLWDLERWREVAGRHATITREAGALSELPLALDSTAVVHVFAGELATASAVVDEVRTVSSAIGSNQPPFGALALAAVRGQEAEARALITDTINGGSLFGQGLGVTVAHCHHAVLCNGLAQYDEAVAAATLAARHQEEFGAPRWALVELVEAAIRSGNSALAVDALERLVETTQASGTDWALGVEARSRALLAGSASAEPHYREAIDRLERTQNRIELARTHLVYGEWLSQESRTLEARAELGSAHEMLTSFGAEGFAERARDALRATGAALTPKHAPPPSALTARETQIARLAREGLTNPEIGARLFLSHHTVEWHLRKVFSKLGIRSRTQLPAALLEGTAN